MHSNKSHFPSSRCDLTIKFPPKLSFFVICQIKFPPKLLFFAIQQICFGFRKLSSSIYHTVDYRYFEHRAISNKILKNMKRQRMRDKNSSLFISLLKLVNFNNTFAPLLYFKLCQDTVLESRLHRLSKLRTFFGKMMHFD